MLKKAMLALGIAGALIIPAGAAVAATDASLESAPVEQPDRNRVTTLTRDQARDRVREQARDQTRDRTMTRDRLRIQDPAACGGTGPKGSSEPGTHWPAGVSGSLGEERGRGAMDGTGPIHAEPADGSGFRYWAGGR
jgi:hypothetical protein